MKKDTEDENRIFAEIRKISIPIAVVLFMGMLVRPSFHPDLFTDWKVFLLTIFNESYGIVMCSAILCLFRFRSNATTVAISAVAVIVLNSVFTFDLRADFADDNKILLLLYIIGLVFGFVPSFFLKNAREWQERDKDAVWRRSVYRIMVCSVIIFGALCFVADAILVIRFIKRYGWINFA